MYVLLYFMWKCRPHLGMDVFVVNDRTPSLQLGLSDSPDLKAAWTPTKVHELDAIGVLKIAVGETATVVIANDANLYSVGTGGVGQLGHQDVVHEKLVKFRKVLLDVCV